MSPSKNAIAFFKFLPVRGHFILRKDIGVGGWSRKWQFSLTLCPTLRRWAGGLKKAQNTQIVKGRVT